MADKEFKVPENLKEPVSSAAMVDIPLDRLLAIIDRLIEQKEIQGLILGGTELPFILRDSNANKIPFLDTTRIHVEQVVSQMLST